MKYLITGIAGLLGSRLADWIVENTDNEVIGIDDLSGGYIENVNSKAKFYKFDLVDVEKVNGVFKNEKPDVAVPLLIENIRILSIKSPEGKEAYKTLMQLGFVDTDYKGQ